MFLEPSPSLRWRPSLATVLSWVFVLGVAAGVVAAGSWSGSGMWGSAPRGLPADRARERPGDLAMPDWARLSHPASRHAATVLRIIDGDTFEARVHVWPGLEVTTRVRLRGIDAAELKAACAQELRLAEAAAAALKRLLADGDVTIFNIGPDKYAGRIVADVATRKTASVSSALLEAGLVRRYAGGRREGWCAGARDPARRDPGPAPAIERAPNGWFLHRSTG